MGGAIALRYMNCFHGFEVCKLILLSAAAPCFARRPGFPYGKPVQEVNDLINLARQTDRSYAKTSADSFLHVRTRIQSLTGSKTSPYLHPESEQSNAVSRCATRTAEKISSMSMFPPTLFTVIKMWSFLRSLPKYSTRVSAVQNS